MTKIRIDDGAYCDVTAQGEKSLVMVITDTKRFDELKAVFARALSNWEPHRVPAWILELSDAMEENPIPKPATRVANGR